MRELIQIGVGLTCALCTVIVVAMLVMSELNFLDLRFSIYFGILGIIAGIAFFVVTRKDDNEETRPAEEKVKK